MDIEIVRELFTRTLDVERILPDDRGLLVCGTSIDERDQHWHHIVFECACSRSMAIWAMEGSVEGLSVRGLGMCVHQVRKGGLAEHNLAANGMLEALVQSRWLPEASEIELLPAFPQQWHMEPCG